MSSTRKRRKSSRPKQSRDARGRFLPRAALALPAVVATVAAIAVATPIAPLVEERPAWTALAIGLEPINPVPVLRREVGQPVFQRMVAPRGHRNPGARRALASLAFLVSTVGACVVWALHTGAL